MFCIELLLDKSKKNFYRTALFVKSANLFSRHFVNIGKNVRISPLFCFNEPDFKRQKS